MKTKVFYLATKITVAVIIVALLFVEAKASDNPALKTVRYIPDHILVETGNDSGTNADLIIEDVEGKTVYYRENILTNDFYLNNFDFSVLPDGDYKIVALSTTGNNEILFTVNGNNITVKSRNNIVNPYVEIKDDILKLSLLNSSLKNIKVVVSNVDGIVYKKELGNNFSINAGFNLANLENGDYAINITDGVNTYCYNFKK